MTSHRMKSQWATDAIIHDNDMNYQFKNPQENLQESSRYKYIQKPKSDLKLLLLYMVHTSQAYAQSQQLKQKVTKLKYFIIDLNPF